MKKFDEARREWMREYLTTAILSCSGNMTEAARLAGKNRTDFYKLCDRAGIKRVDQRFGRRSTTNRGNAAWQSLSD